MPPIFFAWTRSFWLGVVPILLNLADMAVQLAAPGTLGPVAALVAGLTGYDHAQVELVMRGAAAVAGLIIAHQRRGNARPYTLNPRAIQ